MATPQTSASAVFGALASLKLTLAVLLALGLGVALSYAEFIAPTWALALPLLAFAVNLGAAVAHNAVFRRQKWLLSFHLGLIAIIILVATGRMSYLRGTLELADGERFNGELASFEAGPWHVSQLSQVSFTNLGFHIEYAPGVRRGKTRNSVQWRDRDGRSGSTVIGDNDPLVLAGYRFYTSFNKGFAPIFEWRPAKGGEAQLGSVHLPSYPIHEYQQALEWQPPGSAARVWIMLQFDDLILDPDRPSEFRLPKEHRLVLRVGDLRRELKPGDSHPLPDGVLTYRGLGSWMGYNVFYDWTLPWLLAACAFSVVCLGVHYWQKFNARPWNAEAATS